MSFYDKFTDTQRMKYQGLVAEISKKTSDADQAKALIKQLQELLECDISVINGLTYDALTTKPEVNQDDVVAKPPEEAAPISYYHNFDKLKDNCENDNLLKQKQKKPNFFVRHKRIFGSDWFWMALLYAFPLVVFWVGTGSITEAFRMYGMLLILPFLGLLVFLVILPVGWWIISDNNINHRKFK